MYSGGTGGSYGGYGMGVGPYNQVPNSFGLNSYTIPWLLGALSTNKRRSRTQKRESNSTDYLA